MPTYEYECAKCGATFDLFQSMAADPLKVCPKESCAKPRWGKGKVKRVLGSGAGLIFKGSGFYITDYRSEGYKQAAKNDKPAGTSSESSSKPSSDSKPAAKSESKASTGSKKGKAAS